MSETDEAGPVFVVTSQQKVARDVARQLGVHPSRCRVLRDANDLRGRRHIRIAFGYDALDHPRAREIGDFLRYFEQHRGGTVERIEVPA